MKNYKINFLDEAKFDMRYIVECIAMFNTASASKYKKSLMGIIKKLSIFPELGRVYKCKYRRKLHRKHYIFYSIDEQSEIINIHHIRHINQKAYKPQ